MENKKIQFSKQLLKAALLDLMEKKELHKITIKELCAAANVNRSTFYSHYEDIYHLVNEIERNTIEQMPVLSYPVKKTQDEVMKYAEYINEHYKTIDVLAKNGYYTQAAIEYFVNSYTRLSLPKQKPHENNIGLFRFVAAYTIGGTVQCIRCWSKNKQDLSLQQISVLLMDLCNFSIKVREKYESMHNL